MTDAADRLMVDAMGLWRVSAALAARLREIADAWLDAPEREEVYAAASDLERAEAIADAARALIAADQAADACYGESFEANEAASNAYAALLAAVGKP